MQFAYPNGSRQSRKIVPAPRCIKLNTWFREFPGAGPRFPDPGTGACGKALRATGRYIANSMTPIAPTATASEASDSA
jgi:hypothetical protein